MPLASQRWPFAQRVSLPEVRERRSGAWRRTEQFLDLLQAERHGKAALEVVVAVCWSHHLQEQQEGSPSLWPVLPLLRLGARKGIEVQITDVERGPRVLGPALQRVDVAIHRFAHAPRPPIACGQVHPHRLVERVLGQQPIDPGARSLRFATAVDHQLHVGTHRRSVVRSRPQVVLVGDLRFLEPTRFGETLRQLQVCGEQARMLRHGSLKTSDRVRQPTDAPMKSAEREPTVGEVGMPLQQLVDRGLACEVRRQQSSLGERGHWRWVVRTHALAVRAHALLCLTADVQRSILVVGQRHHVLRALGNYFCKQRQRRRLIRSLQSIQRTLVDRLRRLVRA